MLPYKETITDNDLIDEDTQNELMHIRDTFKHAYFYIGDRANEIVERAARNGFHVTDERIYKAVGHFCDRSARSVRNYAQVAAFYPVQVRAEFEELSFSHFMFAMPAKEWRKVLEYAMGHPDISVGGLRGVVSADDLIVEVMQPDNYINDDMSKVIAMYDGYDKQIRETSREPTAPSQITSSVQYLKSNHLSILSSLVDNIDKLLEAVKLREHTRRNLVFALDLIRRSIPEIMDAIKEKQGE